MMKRLMAAMLAVLCLSAITPAARGAETLRARVVLPWFHVWKTDVPDADDRFVYRWSAVTEDAPMPEGVTTAYWDWHLKGNCEGELTLHFTFDTPGAYSYRLAAYVPKPVKGYVYEPRTYLLTVLVMNAPEGGLRAEWNILNEASGAKVDKLDLDPSYSAGETPTEAPTQTPTEKPTQKSSGGGKSGGSGTSGKSGKAAKTGDESRMESMRVILRVSGLLLVYLIYEEVRSRSGKGQPGERR